MFKKMILALLLLNTIALASNETSLSYKKESPLSKFLSTKDTQLAENIYMNINLFTALALIDKGFGEEQSLQGSKPEQTLVTFSFKF